MTTVGELIDFLNRYDHNQKIGAFSRDSGINFEFFFSAEDGEDGNLYIDIEAL